jgi:hypothetical protein
MRFAEPMLESRIRRAVERLRGALGDDGGVVVGGLAVNAHGYQRFTDDVDVLVPADAARSVQESLRRARFRIEGDASGFAARDPDARVRVDVLVTENDGDLAAVKRGEAADFGQGQQLRVAPVGAIASMKLRPPRQLRHHADVVELMKLPRNRVAALRFVQRFYPRQAADLGRAIAPTPRARPATAVGARRGARAREAGGYRCEIGSGRRRREETGSGGRFRGGSSREARLVSAERPLRFAMSQR